MLPIIATIVSAVIADIWQRRCHQELSVSLELLCADDDGVGYRDPDAWTDEDRERIELYEQTRDAQHRLAVLVARSGIAAHVDVMDTDDTYSRHSDAYLRFDLRDLPALVSLIAEAGLHGDILDVRDRSEVHPEALDYIENTLSWTVKEVGP